MYKDSIRTPTYSDAVSGCVGTRLSLVFRHSKPQEVGGGCNETQTPHQVEEGQETERVFAESAELVKHLNF